MEDTLGGFGDYEAFYCNKLEKSQKLRSLWGLQAIRRYYIIGIPGTDQWHAYLFVH